jgi:hypothetical protein
MAFIRYCRLWAILLLLPFSEAAGQTVYYPADASSVLKNTAIDMAGLLQSALQGAVVNTQAYTSMPATGIIFQYDSSMTDNQACITIGNGQNKLLFKAAEDNGLVFGAYQYLAEMGFAFYQPGSIWNVIPSVSSPFRSINKTYNGRYKYQSWFISGGHRLWIMDRNSSYNWESGYIGENGHEWNLFMRRNGMLGKYRFAGHRGDIVSGTYLSTIENNPCYVASNFGSREAKVSSVPDIFNAGAKSLWADAIENKYTQNRNNIFAYPVLYKDQVRSFRYNNSLVGIEVPDGPRWGFGADALHCNNNQAYPSAANQAAILANFTIQQLQQKYPAKNTQVYAYSTHADIPSGTLHPGIDVQVPTAFQSETSIKALFKRWYLKHPNISEYHYLNIPAWSGETPGFSWSNFQQAAQRLKQNNGQGIVIEASPAKFSSIPLLRANNKNLLVDSNMLSELRRFCDQMFGQASTPVYELLLLLGDEQQFLGFKKDNIYRLPLLFDKLRSAHQAAANETALVKQRLAELKAYLHYISLFYDYSFDEKASEAASRAKAGALCIYLAKANKLRIVNSYYMINRLVNDQKEDSSFVSEFNSQNGTAYQQGTIPLITNEEIEQHFQQDLVKYSTLHPMYHFTSTETAIQKISNGDFVPAKKIFVKLGYSLGAQFPNRKEYNFYAAAPGMISVQYEANFDMPEYGQVNFVVEETQSANNIVFDSSVRSERASGKIDILIPAAGNYQLWISTKFKTTVDLEISTGGFAFYKDAAFLGDVRENFNSKPASFPGSFFVPVNCSKVFFSLSNSYSKSTGYFSVEELGKYFIFKDKFGKIVSPQPVTTDSLLFYLDIPVNQQGAFWQFVNTANRYSLCFANISNYYWFGSNAGCGTAGFDIDILRQGDQCLVSAKARNFDGTNEWQVFDKNKMTVYRNQKELVLPAGTSPYAIITHLESPHCSSQKTLWGLEDFATKLEACANGASLPTQNQEDKLVLYPNPSNGIVSFKQGNGPFLAEQASVFDLSGRELLSAANTGVMDISRLPAAIYIFRLQKDGRQYNGKIQKH